MQKEHPSRVLSPFYIDIKGVNMKHRKAGAFAYEENCCSCVPVLEKELKDLKAELKRKQEVIDNHIC